MVVSGDGKVFHSRDGDRWQQASGHADHLYGVAYGNGVFVAVGWGGRILRSTDSGGERWLEASASPADGVLLPLNGVGWNGTGFVAVGEFTILHSSDGERWRDAGGRDIADWLEGVAGANGKSVAVGSTILYGSDGERWKQASTRGTADWLGSVTWGGGRFVAVGSGGTILHSSDGEHWKASASGAANDLAGVVWGAGRFVTVGRNGTIAVSP